MKEFELIERYFSPHKNRKDVVLSIGDDAAIVTPTQGRRLAISSDTMVEGVHFFPDIPPEALAHKILAVNLSDLAAMGAEPAWFTLNLSLPKVRPAWLEKFSAGLFKTAQYYGVQLIGGDTTSSSVLTLSLTIQGYLPENKGMVRSGANIGDWIFVTGQLGDSGLALSYLQNKTELSAGHVTSVLDRHYYPEPRVLAGQVIRDHATSCIDLSDGLASDLKHILNASEVGAVINLDQLPLSKAMQSSLDLESSLTMALTGGEDYELLFTIPAANRQAVVDVLSASNLSATCIGQITSGNDTSYRYEDKHWRLDVAGYQHFETEL